MLRSFLVPAGVVVLLLLAPGVASADQYLVTSCHDPSGAPNAAAGWVASAVPDGQTANTCATNGALRAALVGEQPRAGSDASWRFAAPPGTRIVRVAASRTTVGLRPSIAAQDVKYVMTTNDQVLESCEPKQGSSCVADLTGQLDRQGLNGSHVEFRVLCTNGAQPCTRALAVDATHMYVTLEDSVAPVVSNMRVLDDGEDTGMLRVGFDAGDVGGGLYRVLIKVDGNVAQTIPLGPAPCADVNPSDGDPYQFNVPVPCPAVVTGAGATVDVRTLPAGPHGVEIAIEDAAGNQKAVFGPIEFPRPNVVAGSSVSDALQGRLRMWFVKARGDRRRYSSRFGNRVVTRGVLRTPSGRGIVGARIDVYHIRRDGSRRLLKTGLKSRAGGALTLILPNNVDTRTVEYAYRALRPGPVTSRQRLRLTVRTKNGRVYHRKSASKR